LSSHPIFDIFLFLAAFDFSSLLLVGVVVFLLENAHGNLNLVCITPLVESPTYCSNNQGLIHGDSSWFLILLYVKIGSIFISPLFLLQLASVVFPTHN
jgi:hypothetical protein